MNKRKKINVTKVEIAFPIITSTTEDVFKVNKMKLYTIYDLS
jgi:hypothetical protein